MSRKTTELNGAKVNRLTVLRETRHPERRGRFYVCRCECGAETTVYGGHLRAGTAISCGCARAGANKTHGMSHTPEYRAWENARSRCQNPNNQKYAIYGGRGIRFCQRWSDSFQAFFADMGPRPSSRHSIDRIDSDGDYSPENCRWATHETQNNNRSINRRVVVDGKEMTIAEASRATGIPHGTISCRLNRGWSAEKAVQNG